jgi:hypothetical protein
MGNPPTAIGLLQVPVLHKIVIEMRQIEHALQSGVPEWEVAYMKQVLPMLHSPTSPSVLGLFASFWVLL